MRNLATNLVLAAVSMVTALALGEILLRVSVPKYQYAAESSFRSDDARIWSRVANDRVSRAHPDTGRTHQIEYNNVALRQPRDVASDDLRNLISIAFFGDSYTENLRVPAYAAFTEVLHYLLNRRGGGYTVLNFGVDGYGTDQSYIYYSTAAIAGSAKHVYYVFCWNDIVDVYSNNLFRIDGSGQLQRMKAVKPGLLVRWASKLYLTYLALDARAALLARLLPQRAEVGQARNVPDATFDHRVPLFQSLRGEPKHTGPAAQIREAFVNDDFAAIANYLAPVKAILKLWREEVEAKGGNFTIVLLPTPFETKLSDLLDVDFEVINLYQDFSRDVPGYKWEDFRFARDGHWNERGNLEAAIVLFRRLETVLGMAPMPCGTLEGDLTSWYAAHGAESPVADLPCPDGQT